MIRNRVCLLCLGNPQLILTNVLYWEDKNLIPSVVNNGAEDETCWDHVKLMHELCKEATLQDEDDYEEDDDDGKGIEWTIF